MDTQFILLAWLERATGIDSASLILFLGATIAVSNLIAKIIPSDTTGFWGGLRTLLQIIGLYKSASITSGTSMIDVGRQMATDEPLNRAVTQTIKEIAVNVVENQARNLVEEAVEALVPKPKPRTRSPNTPKSPLIVTMICLALVLSLSGCATLLAAADRICSNQDAARRIATAGLDSEDAKIRAAARVTLAALAECNR